VLEVLRGLPCRVRTLRGHRRAVPDARAGLRHERVPGVRARVAVTAGQTEQGAADPDGSTHRTTLHEVLSPAADLRRRALRRQAARTGTGRLPASHRAVSRAIARRGARSTASGSVASAVAAVATVAQGAPAASPRIPNPTGAMAPAPMTPV